MTNFIEQLEKNSVTFANRLALALDNKKETVTYGELWNLSGKIYFYLKSHGIGKEDFVLINLPRSPKIAVALIGIWRAGAASTITEKNYPAERVDFIRKDCRAKIVIDEKIFAEIMNGETLNGYEKTDSHDACFAVYTSGTTGNPKGVLHEYGELEFCIATYPKFDLDYGENWKHAAPYPLNFVVHLMWLVPQLYFGNSFYILSYANVKDLRALNKILADEKISECFLSPAILKFYKDIPENLRIIYTGSDNVSDTYFENITLINGYGMSETAFFVSAFKVNKPYHKTPVGKNLCGLEILILDEDGKILNDGEQGEICFTNKYFRGYINLPDKTEKVFAGGVFHTGDLGYKDENGDLIISGRRDDMIKIHGNRVEPAEIEIVAKEILGVKNILAKGFTVENSAFVTLYGLTAEIGEKFNEENLPALREKLLQRLPEYMIPTYYLTLEKFPTNANGKVSRKLFPAPNVKIELAEYLPPVTETEKIICRKMSEILGVKQVGRNVDFYQIGGDSLKTILLVTELEELAFQSSDVYKYRTAEKLAAFCDENKNSSVKKFSPVPAMNEKFFPAINDAYQNYLQTGEIKSQYSTFFALNEDAIKKISMSPATEIILREDINFERLQAAVDKAVEVCPYAAFEISKRDDAVYFHKNNLPLIVHKIGAIDEFGTAENNFHYVAVSYDGAKIIFNVSHILTDGFGINCFIQAVLDFYFGKAKTFYDGANKFDFVADLMTQDLPLPAGYAAKSYAVENHFVPSEINSASGKTYENFIEMPAKKFDDFCKKYEISAQIGVSILLAKAVQNAHPDNEKIISVRGPVNTRIPLNVPNTFQNASIPHIFLNISPNILIDKNFDVLKKDFAEQYSYENLAAFTNNVRKFFTTNNSDERAEIVKAYKTQTDIFANYMGKVLADDIATHVESFQQKISASYPLMMYALQYGDKIILQVIQSFENRIYVENLSKVIDEL